MTVDGTFDDWSDAACHVVVDGSKLWIDLRIDGDPVNLQQLPTPLELQLVLDDGTQRTIELVFSPTPAHMGVGLWITHPDGRREQRSAYDLNVMFAPTVAANRFELVVDLASAVPAGSHVRLLGLPHGDAVDVQIQSPASRPSADVPSGDHDALRIVSWNVQFGELLKQPERSGAVLRALSPDVLLLQELEDEQTIADLRSFLNRTLGADPSPWHATASPVGTHLRSMVAARSDLLPPPSPTVTSLDEPIRVAFMPIDWNNRLLLAGSLHLQCCGGIDGPEDRKRIAQSGEINAAIDELVATGRFVGVILGGDLNLVGSDIPLQLLINERDVLHADVDSSLLIADGMQLDRESAITWSDTTSRFTPGRLDWIVYSGSGLHQERSFVFDSADLSPSALERHELQRADTSLISDHLPLVLDVSIR